MQIILGLTNDLTISSFSFATYVLEFELSFVSLLVFIHSILVHK